MRSLYIIFFLSLISRFCSAQTISPDDIPGLSLWLSADSADVAGGKVVTWYDKSTANHATQASASLQPVFADSVLNNLPVIRFDGLFSRMTGLSEIPTIHNSSFTVFIVFAGHPVSNQTIECLFTVNDYSNGFWLARRSFAVEQFVTSYNNGLNAITTNAGSVPNTGSPFGLLTYKKELNVQSDIYLNGSGHSSSTNPSLCGPFTNTNYSLGQSGFGFTALTGDIAEVIVYSQALNDSLRNSIEAYLSNKYAPPVVLPADIVSMDNFCSRTVKPVNPANNQYTYLWSTGATADSIVVTQAGTYWVNATNIFGKISSDTIVVSYPAIAPYTGNLMLCQGSAVDWNTLLPKDLFSFQWNDGSDDSLITITQGGQYYVEITDTSGCTVSSDTITISPDNFPGIASVGPDTQSCGDYILSLISGNGSGVSYVWNDASTNDSLVVTTSGQYSVTVTNANNCTATDTVDILIFPVPVFNLGNDTDICFNAAYTIAPNLPNASHSFAWSDLSTDSTLNPTHSGEYWVTITNSFNCTFSDTIELTIDSSLFTASLGSDTSLCAGNFISLVSGNGPGLSYVWNDNSTNSSLVVNASGQYHVTVSNNNNCSKKDTINVNVAGFAPTADFFTSLACQHNLVLFTDNSAPPGGDTITGWHWNFGDSSTLADTSVLQNVSYTYADSGAHTITLVVETNAGCKQTFTRTIQVYPLPLVNFTNSMACKNDSVLFTNTSGSPGYVPLGHSWNFADPGSGTDNLSSLADPAHIFSQQTIYAVKLVTTNSAGCRDSITRNINVKAEVSADFNYTAACTNAPLILQDNSIVPAPNNTNIRSWTIGASTYTGLTASHLFPSPGTFPVQLTVTGNNGCVSSITRNIDIHAAPHAQLIANPVCANDTFRPLDLSTGNISQWRWESNGLVISTASDPEVIVTAAGTDTIKLLIQDPFGCKDSATGLLTVHALPNPNFTTTPASLYFANTPVVFTPAATNGVSYLWTTDTTSFTGSAFSHSFGHTGIATVSMSITDSNGCTNSLSKNLNIRDRLLDLAVLDVRTYTDQEGSVSIEADLVNLGTLPVTAFELEGRVTNASVIRESWSGFPSGGGYFTYIFYSKAFPEIAANEHIACVTILSVNGTQDADPGNNSLCISTASDRTSVLDPYPNPGRESITIPVTLKSNAEILFRLIDLLGKEVIPPFITQGTKGLNLVSLPLSLLNSGQYQLIIVTQDKTFTKKITKID